MSNPHLPSAPKRPLRVLLDISKGSSKNNPYVELLLNHIPGDIEVLKYKRDLALAGDYDVVHMHWPEHRLSGQSLRIRMKKRLIFFRWMRRLRQQGTPVVRTRHNRAPHDRISGLDRLLLRKVPPLVHGQVWLTESSMHEAGLLPSRNEAMLPHGDYGPWIARVRPDVDTHPTPAVQIRLVSFGAIKPYKNLCEAIEAVAGSDDFALVVAGECRDPRYLRSLTKLAAGANVEVREGRVPDEVLLDLVLGSDAVVIPYKDFYNSGVAFLALSLDRPVVVPDGPMTRELRDEFGAEWVGLYDSPLTPDGLRRAWDSVRHHTDRPTDLVTPA